MKIYNWIDSFFDTKEKRRNMATLLCLLYLLWQNIWKILLYIRLFQIKTYDSLFDFLPSMKGYTSSVFVRFLYEWIQSGSLGFITVIQNSIHALTIIDILFILCIILLSISAKCSQIRTLWIIHLSIFVWTGACIVIGLTSSSLQDVIYVLQTLSVGGIVLEIVCIYSILNRIRDIIMVMID